MRAIILAAGAGERWENYQGIPKHFAVVDEQPILVRTVNQLKQYKEIDDETDDFDSPDEYEAWLKQHNQGV